MHSTIDERLTALERSNRRNRKLIALLSSALLAIGVLAAMPGTEETIRTRNLVIENNKGASVVRIASMPDGLGYMLFSNNEGRPVAAIQTRQTGGALVLYNTAGKLSFLASTTEEGDGMSVISDRTGETTWSSERAAIANRKRK